MVATRPFIGPLPAARLFDDYLKSTALAPPRYYIAPARLRDTSAEAGRHHDGFSSTPPEINAIPPVARLKKPGLISHRAAQAPLGRASRRVERHFIRHHFGRPGR